MRQVFKRLTMILAFALITTSLISSPASADPGSKDPGVLDHVIVDTTSSAPGGGLTVLTSGCTTTYHSITGYGTFGDMLWRLEQNTYWCWDGATVTYASRSTPTHTYGLGWRLVGIVSSTESGVGTYEYRAYVQAHFYRCYATPWGETCIDDVYPWIQSILRGDGTNGGSAGT